MTRERGDDTESLLAHEDAQPGVFPATLRGLPASLQPTSPPAEGVQLGLDLGTVDSTTRLDDDIPF